MAVTASKFNMFSFFKLPAAWWCGVRLREIDKNRSVVTVTHRWINQNPFNSMFWAVQGMAAELSTGEGQTIWMKSVGVNEDGVVVSTFDFEWTVRLKQKK